MAVPDAFSDANLLDLLREAFKLTGTRYGCGVGQCGACTVHIDGVAQPACMTAVDSLGGAEVTTIEGLAISLADGTARLHPVQEAWLAVRVPQCGFCQSGQIMSASALYDENPNATEEEFREHMKGVACRCGTYHRILDAYARVFSTGDEP